MNRRFQSLLDIQKTKISCVDLVEFYLGQIQAQNASLNAFIEVWEKEARTRAKEIDEKIKKDTAGKLAGMVIGLKDNLLVKNQAASNSSKILSGFTSPYTASAIQKLLDEDAILIGRLNNDEFAMGSSNETSFYGPVKNAIDLERVPGGSSGGSAVAVQAEMCTAALGTDTGGSVRQPAAFTGTIGLKPSYGRISRYGVMSYASSFDQIGPISYSISDAAILLEVMSGKDPKDATSSSKKVEAYSALKPNEPKRIAYIEPEGLDDEVSKAYTYQIEKISASKHQLERISIDFADALVPTYYVLTTAEASSNLSRYAGMIYGHQSKKQNSLDEMIMQSRNEGFGPEVKRRIMTGTFILSEEHFEAYYTKALLVRRKIKNRLNEIFENFDAILSPTAPTVPFKLNEKKQDPIAMYLADQFTVMASLGGVCAISIPMKNITGKLPLGLQITCNSFCEKSLLNLANELV